MIGTPKDQAVRQARANVRLSMSRVAYDERERAERSSDLLNRIAELLLAMTSRPDLGDP